MPLQLLHKAVNLWRRLMLGAALVRAPLVGPALASQSTLATPGSPLPMTALASFLNVALLSIGSCNSGTTAPANGTGGAAFRRVLDQYRVESVGVRLHLGWHALGRVRLATRFSHRGDVQRGATSRRMGFAAILPPLAGLMGGRSLRGPGKRVIVARDFGA